MKTMKNAKSIAIAIVLAAMLTGSLTAAETRKARLPAKTQKKLSARATRAPGKLTVQQQVWRYTHYYKLNEADQARIEKILLAQQKDMADFNKVHGPKIAAVDEQIKKLKDEIKELEKTKSVQLKVLAELKLDHEAELDKAFTDEQKATLVATYLKGYDTASFWKYLPKEVQATLEEQCQAAAMELILAGNSKPPAVLRDASRKLRATLDKTLTPEVRQAAETRQMQEYTMRGFARYELTDDQKARIGELCAKNVKDRLAISGRYRQLSDDLNAMRRTMYKSGSSSYHHAIRTEVVEKILTEEQKKRLPGKYRKTSTKDKKAKPSKKKSKGNSTI
ncbi:MAG: hypothetical protein H8E53_06945 [Planctomycetes bacterium]|nr:hypothetical protein [Planctomycetota bacterium]